MPRKAFRRLLTALAVTILAVAGVVPPAQAATYGPSWKQFRYDECPAILQNQIWRDYYPPSNTGIGDYSAATARGDVDVCYDEYVAERAPGAKYDVWVIVLRSRNHGYTNAWNREETNAWYEVSAEPYANTISRTAFSGSVTKASCRTTTVPIAVGSGAIQVGTDLKLSSCAPLKQTSAKLGTYGARFRINANAGFVTAEHALIVKSPVGKRPLFTVKVKTPWGARTYVDAPLGRIYKEKMNRFTTTTYL